MTVSMLSSSVDDFLAMTRVRADVDPRSGPDRRRMRYTERLLRDFIDFWKARGCPCPIRATLALDWVAVGRQTQHPFRDQHRIQTIRAFLTQVRAVEPDTEVPPNIFGPRRRRRQPYVFSNDEIERLLAAPHRLRLADPRRSLMLVTLMGLLASTGLRIGEALRLTVADVRVDADPAHLVIVDTKFGKSRVVVLHASTADRMRTYAATRATLRPRTTPWFFITPAARRLTYTSMAATFRRLLQHAGIQTPPGRRPPSLHSFRHTFAVNRLTQWHREQRDVQAWLPHLSVYLGHLAPADTYWYLSSTADLLQMAAHRMVPASTEGGDQ
jgi:integrase